jgi:hypothetical protein
LYAYLLAAVRNDHQDLAQVFRAKLHKRLAIPDWDGLGSIEPRDNSERLQIAGMLASLRGEVGFERFQGALLQALEGPERLLIEKLRRHGVWKVLGVKPRREVQALKAVKKDS